MRFIVKGIIAGCLGGVVVGDGFVLLIGGGGGGLLFLRNEATGFLQFGESVKGAEEAAFGGVDGAGEESEQTAIDRSANRIGLPGGGFHFAKTAETPEVVGELVDEDLFGGRGGLVLAAERGAEFVEFSGVFTGPDELLRVEAVFEGVLGGAGFPFGGARAGGALGIAAVDGGATFFEGVERRCVKNHGVRDLPGTVARGSGGGAFRWLLKA